MIGHAVPHFTVRYQLTDGLQTFGIDMVQLHNGQSGWVRQVLASLPFIQSLEMHHVGKSATPIIEIARHQERGVFGNFTFDVLKQLLNLAYTTGRN